MSEIDRHMINNNELKMPPMDSRLKVEIICVVLILAIALYYFVRDERDKETNVHNTIGVVHINDTVIEGPVDYYKILSTGLIEVSIGGVVYTTNIENVSLMTNEEE